MKDHPEEDSQAGVNPADSASTPPLARASRHHLLDGTVRVFLSEALIVPTGLLTAAFLTRRLGAVDYGIYTVVAALVAWIEWGVASIFERASILFIAERGLRTAGATVIRVHLVFSIAAAVLLWVFSSTIATLLKEPGAAAYLRLFAIDIPLFSLAQAHRQILVGIGGFRARALTSAGRWTMRLILIVVLVESGLSVTGAIAGCIGASVVELVIARCCVRPAFTGSSTVLARQFFSYGLPLGVVALGQQTYEKLDLMLLKALGKDPAEVGLYGAVQNLCCLPGIFALAFAPLLLTTVSRALRDGNREEARGAARNAMRVVTLLFPTVAVAAGAGSEISAFLFGSEFAAAGPILAVLIFGGFSLLMISVATAILTAAGKLGCTIALMAPLLPLALVGHLLVIPRWGAVGAAGVTTLLAMGGALVVVAAVYCVLQTLPPVGSATRSVIAGAVGYALAVLWPSPGVQVLLKLPVVLLVTAACVVFLGEFRGRELAYLRGLLRTRRSSHAPLSREDETPPRGSA